MLNELPVQKIKLTEIEQKVIKARQVGFSVSQFDHAGLKTIFDELILNISVISGAPMPNTNFLADALNFRLIDFLQNFGYGNLTIEEIVQAFYFNAKGGLKFPSGIDIDAINFSGGYVNVEYVSKVLSNYMAVRNILDRKIQNLIDEQQGF
jgi:hypothetical protein